METASSAYEEISVGKGSKTRRASRVAVLCVNHLQFKPYESYFKEHLVSVFGWVKPEAWRMVSDGGAPRVPQNPKPF